MVPRLGVAGHRLAEQDIVAVGLQHAVVAVNDRQQHGGEPEADGQQHHQRTGQRLEPGALAGGADLGPVGPERRDQHQSGDDADPLGDDAEACGKPAQVVPAPAAMAEQKAQEAVEAQGDEEGDQGIDLGGLGLQGELGGKEQQQTGTKRGLAVPQPAGDVIDQGQGAKPGQQAGQEEGHLHGAHQSVAQGDGPHEHGRLVRIDLATAEGEEPLA